MNTKIMTSLSFMLISTSALAFQLEDEQLSTKNLVNAPQTIVQLPKIKTREWGTQFDTVKNFFGQTTDDRAKLNNIRKDNSDKFQQLSKEGDVDMRAFLKTVDTQNKEFVSAIIDEEVKSMGIDANNFSVFTMGSMARGESGLYTDLEIFFVVKEKTILAQYTMEKLAQRLSDRFFRLGEHPDVGGKGLRIDEAGNAPFHLRFAGRQMDPEQQGKVMRAAIANRDFKAIPFEGCRMMLVTPEELSNYHDTKYTKQLLDQQTAEEKLALKEQRRQAFWEAYSVLRADSENDHKSDAELHKQIDLYAQHLYKRPSPKEAKHAEDLGTRLMRNVAPLYDKGGMFAQYWTKREQILDGAPNENPDKNASRRQEIAKKLMVDDGVKYVTDPSFNVCEGKLGDMIDLKRELYRIPEQILTNLGFYYNVGAQNTLDIIQVLNEKGIFDDAFAQDVKELMSFAMQMNIKQQSIMKKQGFAVYISQDKYDADMKELKTAEANLLKKIEILKLSDSSAKDIQKAKDELAVVAKEMHDLETVAPGKILSDAEVGLLSTKYIPMLKAFYDKAFAWAGKEGEQALKGSLLPSVALDKESAPIRDEKLFVSGNNLIAPNIFLDYLLKLFAAPAA